LQKQHLQITHLVEINILIAITIVKKTNQV